MNLKLFEPTGVSNRYKSKVRGAMTTAEAIDQVPEVLDLEERNWLPRHCRGDASAFGKLIAAYRALVFTFLHRYGVRSDECDDLFQEIFLKIHLAAGSYQPTLYMALPLADNGHDVTHLMDIIVPIKEILK